MSVNQRVIKICEFLNLNQAEFARQINVLPQTINNQIKGKNSLSYETILAIATRYPNLSLKWLIAGEGEMWDYQENLINANQSIINNGHGNNQNIIHTKDELYERIIKDREERIVELKERLKKYENN
jgi:plasmid maintenance system antidote protein VapI